MVNLVLLMQQRKENDMEFSEEWVVSTEHPGYRVKKIKHGNATIEIYRPELSDTERKKREASITRVTEKVLFNYYTRKEREKCQTQSQSN